MSRVIYDFTGEHFVVTGASSGIGRKIALDLAASGAEVLAIGRNAGRLESVRSESPGRIFTASVDVCDAGSLEEAIAHFVENRGRLSGGVHAAGIDSLTPLRSFTNGGGGIEIMDTSFWAGMELLSMITSPKYSRSGTSTVLISSASALTCDKGKFAYVASKSAVNAAVRSAALEIAAEGHRVNTVLPGWTMTPMTERISEVNDIESVLAGHPLGVGKPEDISGVVMFLLSDDSNWLTGANIPVDGGYSA